MTLNSEQCEAVIVENYSRGFFWYFGVVLAFYILFKVLRSLWRGLYTCFLADMLGFTVNWKKLGRWAVITGGTDGIGKAYAKALAAKGFDIVLISRTLEKLKAVAEELENKYQVKTKIVVADMTGDPAIYDAIKENLQDLEIGVLVNNVGMSYSYPEYITKVPEADKLVDNLIKANIISCTKMTQIVLPKMEQRRKGVIMNIASLSAISPVPLLSVYSSCKAYVHFFTRATQEEYKTKGIVVQAVLPGFVSTKMSKMRPSFTICTPEAFVKWAMRSVGVEERTYGYPAHKLHGYGQELLEAFLPENISLAVAHRMMNDIRLRYYKKYGIKESNSSTPLLSSAKN